MKIKCPCCKYPIDVPLINYERRLTLDHILTIVCEFHDIRREALLAKTRKREIAHARMQIMWLCREAGYSSTAIGRVLNKERTTVLHGTQAIQDLIDTYTDEKRQIQELLQMCNEPSQLKVAS